MLFRQFVDDDLGCASYLVGDEHAGVAVVVDPAYRIEPYLEEAEQRGVRLTAVLETHTHADHVSGHGRLALEHGLPVYVHDAAAAEYAHEPLADGSEIELGEVVVRTLHTPGHRPEHCAFAVIDRTRGDEPWLVLTGDSLFVGDAARPDLAIDARDGAEDLFRSLHRLVDLGDGVEVFPGHVAGSLCGAAMSSKASTTIGFECRYNHALLEDQDEFLGLALGPQPPRPPNMERIVELNRGPFVAAQPPLQEIADASDAVVLDARPARDFADGHRPGAVNVPVSGSSFATKTAFVLPDLPVVASSNGKISVDDEAVVHVGDGTVWVSDEYGPYVYHYADNGALLHVIRPPAAFIPMRRDTSGNLVENFSANSPPTGQSYNTGNPVSGRQNNQGFEGLAMSPDRKTLFVLLQSALIQDLDPTSSPTIKLTRHNTRMLAYDLRGHEPKLVGEYVVQLPLFQDQTTTKPTLLTAAQSELLALNNHQFLVLARDSSVGSTFPSTPGSVYRSIDLLDISDATNIAGTAYDTAGTPVAPLGVLNSSIKPATYQKFLDINDNAQLNRFGLHNGAPNDGNDLYEKWESMAVVPIGDRQAPNDYFLFVGSDNDFITQQGRMAGQSYADASGANVDTLVLVYRVTLPTYVQPEIERRFDSTEHGHHDGFDRW